MSRSSLFPERLYFVNDAGNSNSFYYSDLSAQTFQRVRMIDYFLSKEDIEDLDVGPCYEESCLFVGAIGDNRRSASTHEIVLIKEAEAFNHPDQPDAQAAAADYLLNFSYPDGPHDAEGLAVHPNGDIYILSKERPSLTGVAPAQLYRLKAADWQSQPDLSHVLSPVGSIDLSKFSSLPFDIFSHIVTGFDIAEDGTKFLLLTYGNAFEFEIDLSNLKQPLDTLIHEGTVQEIPLRRLPQQESISYLGHDRFIYTTEVRGGMNDLIEVRCTL